MGSPRHLTLVAACVAVVVVVSGCSSPAVLDPGDVEEQISAGLEQQVGGTFTTTCPPEIRAEADGTFTCSVRDEVDGITITVTVNQDDGEGAFSWRVASVSED